MFKQFSPRSYRKLAGAICLSIAQATHFTPTLFALAPSFHEQYTEVNHVGAYRSQVLGSRKLVLCRTPDVISFIESQGKKPTLKDACVLMREMTVEQATKFLEIGPIYYGALNPGDTMWTPPGWLASEGALGKDPCVGVRMQSLSLGHLPMLEKMESILADKIGKPNEVLSTLKDRLLLSQ